MCAILLFLFFFLFALMSLGKNLEYFSSDLDVPTINKWYKHHNISRNELVILGFFFCSVFSPEISRTTLISILSYLPATIIITTITKALYLADASPVFPVVFSSVLLRFFSFKLRSDAIHNQFSKSLLYDSIFVW